MQAQGHAVLTITSHLLTKIYFLSLLGLSQTFYRHRLPVSGPYVFKSGPLSSPFLRCNLPLFSTPRKIHNSPITFIYYTVCTRTYILHAFTLSWAGMAGKRPPKLPSDPEVFLSLMSQIGEESHTNHEFDRWLEEDEKRTAIREHVHQAAPPSPHVAAVAGLPRCGSQSPCLMVVTTTC